MANFGHNKPPHQLETIELEGIPVTLYKRSDHLNPLWQMRIKMNGSDKYIRRSTKSTDLEKAKEAAYETYIELKVKLQNNIPIFNKTMGEVCRELLKELQAKFDRGDIAKTTFRGYKTKLERYYIPYFDKKQIVSINQNTIDDYWEWRINYWKNSNHNKRGTLPNKDHTPKAATLHIEAMILNMMLNKAVKQGSMQHHLRPGHKPPLKNVKNRRSELSREEYKQLSRYMSKWLMTDTRIRVLYPRNRLRYMIKIAVSSGMRPTEMYNLKWNDYSKQSVDGIEWTELRVQGKGKKHTIRCKIRVFNDLENFKMDSFHTEPNDYVFANYDGNRPKELNTTFKTLLVEAGIPLELQGEPRTLYSLRHTYATLQLRSDVGVNVLSDNMSTSINMIKEHYGHVKGADRARLLLLDKKGL